MKPTCILLVTLFAGFTAAANPTDKTAEQQNGLRLSARQFSNRSSLLNPVDASGRGRGAVWRFGAQVMPMLEVIGQGKNSEADANGGMLTYKKMIPTIGAGLVLKIEPNPYFQFETGINYVRKSYKFEQKSFVTDGVSGDFTLDLNASHFEFPLLLSFGFGASRTQKTFFRPVIGLTLCRYQYGDSKQKNGVRSSDANLTFDTGPKTLRELNTTTSSSSALGVIGFRILSEYKKTAFEYGLSYYHDLGEGDQMDVVTIISDKTKNPPVVETHSLKLIAQTGFIRAHVVYYFYSQH